MKHPISVSTKPAAGQGLQTWIVWNQSQFLAIQTRAAQIEQAAKLRERLVTTVGFKHRLDGLIIALKPDDSDTACISECNEFDVRKLILTLRSDVPKPLSIEEYVTWAEFARKVHYKARLIGSHGASPPNNSIVSTRKLIDEVIRPVSNHCRFDFEKTVDTLEEMEKFESMVSQIMEIDRATMSTRNGSQQHSPPLNAQVAATYLAQFIRLGNAGIAEGSEHEQASTLSALLKGVAARTKRIADRVRELSDQCARVLAQDREELEAMERR